MLANNKTTKVKDILRIFIVTNERNHYKYLDFLKSNNFFCLPPSKIALIRQVLSLKKYINIKKKKIKKYLYFKIKK